MEVTEEEKDAIVGDSYTVSIITNTMRWHRKQTLILGCVTGEFWQESVNACRFCHLLGKLHAVLTTILQ